MAQRITRAKLKIASAGIPYRIPAEDELGGRLAEVLAVIYLLFNEAYLSSGGEQVASRDLADDAEFLAGLLHRLMPTEPEVIGLLALIRLHRARAAVRFDDQGGIIQLSDQDRTCWDHAAIAHAIRLITKAASFKRPSPYQIRAAIVACHAEAPTWNDTDWPQIVLLYTMLDGIAPSPVTKLHRAVALRNVTSPAAALAEVDKVTPLLDNYHLLHATRAELLRDLGRFDEARIADLRALQLTANPAEQAVLQRRLAWR